MTRNAALAACLLACLWVPRALAEGGGAPEREHYVLHCSGCHGLQGRGVPGTTPTLHDLARVLEAPGGRAYLVRVPGVAQAPLDDAALARLLGWVLEEFSGVAPAPPFAAAEVGLLRRSPLRDPLAARAALAIGPAGAPERVQDR